VLDLHQQVRGQGGRQEGGQQQGVLGGQSMETELPGKWRAKPTYAPA
jgi:hypothetical protein